MWRCLITARDVAWVGRKGALCLGIRFDMYWRGHGCWVLNRTRLTRFRRITEKIVPTTLSMSGVHSDSSVDSLEIATVCHPNERGIACCARKYFLTHLPCPGPFCQSAKGTYPAMRTGPGVPPGGVSSLNCPSLSYSGHP